MFCNPLGGDAWSRVSCGLYFLGSGDANYLIDEEEEVQQQQQLDDKPQVSWLVAKGPKAMQRPIVFNQRGFESFRVMATRPTDILVTSYPRCGLSWLHALTFALLEKDDTCVGWKGPVYCEARSSARAYAEKVATQSTPRLFSTHARPENWPAVLDAGGKVVVITRDPRDALVSTFFRLRELGTELQAYAAVDDRIGNCATACANVTMDSVFDDFHDDGFNDSDSILSLLIEDGFDEDPGGDDSQPQASPQALSSRENSSAETPNGRVTREALSSTSLFSRSETLDDDDETPHARPPKRKNTRFYSDYYGWHLEMASLAAQYPTQVLLIQYEDLQMDIAKEGAKIQKFLRSTVDIDRAVEFASFEATKDRGDSALRKGVSGDHRIYLTKEHWDAVCRKTLLEFADVLPLRPLCTRIATDCPNALAILPKRLRTDLNAMIPKKERPVSSPPEKSHRPSPEKALSAGDIAPGSPQKLRTRISLRRNSSSSSTTPQPKHDSHLSPTTQQRPASQLVLPRTI